MADDPPPQTDPGIGLNSAEADRRRDAGLANRRPDRDPRSLVEIVRTNVLTRFNLLLGLMGAAIIATGAYRDALFVMVAVVNTAIGVVQEVRARRTLRRLELIDAPTTTVVRDGAAVEVDVQLVVLGDIVIAGRGDQIVADGVVVANATAEVDESLLTGESDPIRKHSGDQVLSGSVVVSGTCRYEVTAVGEQGFANGLVIRAREFRPARFEIRTGIDRILRYVTWLLVPTAALLVWSQLVANSGFAQAVQGAVAGIVSMVPEGLVLLTSLAMAAGVVRLARDEVLTRELAAIEGLARVDTVCIDKTGTLTSPGLRFVAIESLDSTEPSVAHRALGALARLDGDPNPTAAALADEFADPSWSRTSAVAFSSARKWSGAEFDGNGVWVLGAPDVLPVDDTTRQRASSVAATGDRTLLLAQATTLHDEELGDVRPIALVRLAEPVKPSAASTMQFLRDQGVDVKVISGDHPRTVAAVAAGVGLPTGRVVDAWGRGADDELVQEAIEADVVGRVGPDQKAAIVVGLQRAGRTVAMAGDGVNDLLALKEADVGVAMGAGSAASRAVAQLVLLDSDFSAVPRAVGEGRRLIGNIERVANLFLVKTTYAFALALAVGVARLPFPLLPRHLSLVAALTIGIPGFVLALEPNARPVRPGFVERVLAFAIPTGLVAATATFVAYADLGSDGATLDQSRTAATIILFAVGMWAVTTVTRPLNTLRATLLAAMIGAFVLAILSSPGKRFFALEIPPRAGWWVLAAATTAGIAAAELLHRRVPGLVERWRRTGDHR